MDYNFDILVNQLGKLYGHLLRQHPEEEFPEFVGQLSDLLDAESMETLPQLQGEYVIAYHGRDVKHLIHVYFEEDTFEVAGTPAPSNFSGLYGTIS